MQHYWVLRNLKKEDFVDLRSTLHLRSKEIESLISFYFHSEGATAEDLIISSIEKSSVPDNGKLHVQFKISYFNLCWDIDDHDAGKMELEFYCNQERQEIKLFGPEW